MHLELTTLENTPIPDIHHCFGEAFSDYIVDIRIPEPAFREMNALRAVDYGLSIGAFHEGQLVGITLNGADLWLGKRTAYDSGTGVIPAFRGRGVSRAIMLKAFEVLKSRGYEQYLLEVITSNTKALKLYESLGFRIMRKLECVILKNRGAPADNGAFTIGDVAAEDLPRLQQAFEAEKAAGFEPSWQNSWNTIRRRPDLYTTVACLEQDRCLGYGVISAGRGSIAQIWVRSDLRRQGLGSALLYALMRRSPDVRAYSWVNVDAESEATLRFLRKRGFVEQLAQYEMMRDL